MLDICQETTDFVRACEAIHAQMAREPLTSDDRDLIEFSGSELLSKLRPAYPMEKHCSHCSLPFECAASSPECWCRSIPAWQPAREASSDCLCKLCLSLIKFWSPEELHTIWRL